MNAVKVPPTVQAVIAARIDRLPAEEKELLQTLAVLGRDFPFSLVRSVTLQPDDELNRMLGQLQLAEFIYEQPATGDVEYIFKHALTQEVAYNSVLVERRRQLHERVAAALETLYANSVEEHLAELAHHYGHSAHADKAVDYLTRAGQQALNCSAYAEAQAQFQQGLEWIKKMQGSSKRDECELELVSTLAQVLAVTTGWGAPETGAAAERARDLAEKSGNLSQLVVQVFGTWRKTVASGEYRTARLLADRILDLAERESSPASFAFACAAQQTVGYYRGEFTNAEASFARWSRFLEAPGFRQVPGAAADAIARSAICVWALGHADLARLRMAQMIASVQAQNRPLDLAVGRLFESVLSCGLREPEQTQVAAMQAIALAEEHGFPLGRDLARGVLGWALAHLGRAREAVVLIHQSIAGLTEAGNRMIITAFLTYLAEAQALDGKLDNALVTIDEALQANPEELIFRPDALACRGELRAKLGETEVAEADFRDAIALAQDMSAKSFELRITTRLARLLRDTNRLHEGRAILAEIYNWFTEGFDTADLKDAKELLDELSG
jgi:tetratricopeptide (TPR) repeat protein